MHIFNNDKEKEYYNKNILTSIKWLYKKLDPEDDRIMAINDVDTFMIHACCPTDEDAEVLENAINFLMQDDRGEALLYSRLIFQNINYADERLQKVLTEAAENLNGVHYIYGEPWQYNDLFNPTIV